MRKKIAAYLGLCVFLLLAIFYLWRPSAVPNGQEPFLTLSNANFSEFQKAFNAQADGPRMVLLLSPT